MASKWRKAKIALGLNLCVYVPRTQEESSSTDDSAGRFSDVTSLSHLFSVGTGHSESRLLPSSSPSPSSSGFRSDKSGNKSSKKTCAICLGTMKPGKGHALFTAECSHTFHFHCIASNVKHGNQVCPVCRAKWIEIPCQEPTRGLPNGRVSINPGDWAGNDALMTVLNRLPPRRENSNGHMTSLSQIPEPSAFCDDEALDDQTEVPEKHTARFVADQNSMRTLEIKMHPEVSAVQRSTAHQNFTVLVNLKAPVTSSRNNAGRNQANTPPTSQTSRAPVDLVTVLDVSGSMAGTKIALLKRAMGFVIHNLGPSDRLSVIAFSSTARRLFRLRRMTDAGRQQALQAVNALTSNGGTNIAEALRKAARVMEDRRVKNPVSSIILLSDGQDTYTVSGHDQTHQGPNYRSLLPFSARDSSNSEFQVPVHAFGFGVDHDAALMHSISETSGGTFSFIEAEGVIQAAFAQCIGGLLSVVIQDLRVSIECIHPDLHLNPLKAGSYGTRLINNSRTGIIDVGDLYADEERDFLISVNLPVGDSSNEMTLLKVKCSYKDPILKETFNLESKEVMIQRPDIVKEFVISHEVDRQKNRVNAAEAITEARTAAEKGELSNAVSILENYRKVLSETISAKAGDRLCIALDAELKEMQERMTSRRKYEASGRAYVLSGLSSHSWQRATARGDSTDNTTLVHAYQTPSMVDMLTRSQTMLLGGSLPQPSLRPAKSFPIQLRPR